MTLYNFPNMTAGPDQVFIDTATQIPVLPIMMLVCVWVFVFGGGSMAQARRQGYIDPAMWSTLAFLTVDLIALIFSLSIGIEGPVVLAVCISLTLFSFLWLFLTRGRFDN